LCAAGKASLLVPYPFAADQHQLRNARAMEQAGAARLVLDAELTGERLVAEVQRLLGVPGRLNAMEGAARRLALRGAAERAADVLEDLAAGIRRRMNYVV
jgi:UDP-N-acetylglucosamine--N-acetylmuramyl-(pentapeptide) pyrophosphoryl-undecaprenol N-acetylglucosamine transferase